MRLSAADLDLVRRCAVARCGRYKNDAFSHYQNTEMGHFVGALGEMAFFRWAELAGLEPVGRFLETDGGCDVLLPTRRLKVEVKSWRDYQMSRFGRAIAAGQFSRVRHKANILVWCSVHFPHFVIETIEDWLEFSDSSVDVTGWNWVSEFDAVKETTQNGYVSRQILVQSVHSLKELYL
jgi:hypothetical protein